MESKYILKTDGLNFKEIGERLYDPEKNGVVSLENIVVPEFMQRLKEEILTTPFLKDPKTNVGRMTKNFHYFYVGEGDDERIEEEFDKLSALKAAYKNFYDCLGEELEFRKNGKESIIVQHFKKGQKGLIPHRDKKAFINLISVVVVEGKSQFYVCEESRKYPDRELYSGRKKVPLIPLVPVSCAPGTMILMRAPRNEEENALRPIHSLGKVIEDRYSVVFREII